MRHSARLIAVLSIAAGFEVLAIRAACAYPFEYKTLFLITAKMNPLFDPDSSVDDFMQLFRPTVYNKFHGDEFAFKQKEQDTLPVMKSMIDGYDLKQPIVITTHFQVGNYDFDNKRFPIVNFDSQYFFQAGQNCCTTIPQSIRYYLSNWTAVGGVPVPEAAAKAFVERNKVVGGINRQVIAEIYTVPVKVGGEDEVTGRIDKIVFKDPSTGGLTLGEVAFKDSAS